MFGSLVMLAAEAPAGIFDSAFRLFDQGGPVMWPILVVSLMGVSVAFERIFAFWKYNAANVYFSRTQKKVLADLNKIIDLQRENIAKTKQCQEQRPVPAWPVVPRRRQHPGWRRRPLPWRGRLVWR